MENVTQIFDALMEASDRKHKYFKAKELESDIVNLSRQCGSCENWMIESKCNREASGIKVSCNQSICDKFQMNTFTSKLIYLKREEIQSLNKVLTTP